MQLQTEMIEFLLQQDALCFGQFTLKSGKQSPYFFNAGHFNDGASLQQLGFYYAQLLKEKQSEFNVIFGPAYKGIPLALASSMALSQLTQQVQPFCFNRKEQKDHGEGGTLIGANINQQKIMIVDDVVTMGSALHETLPILRAHGAQAVGIVVMLDRQEKSIQDPNITAVQHLQKTLKLPIYSLITLSNILAFVKQNSKYLSVFKQLSAYAQHNCCLSEEI